MAEEATLAEDGTLTFATRGLRRGAHQVLLLDKSGEVVSRAPFWLYRPGERTKVRTSKRVYEKGERIGVSWSNAPGMRWDWLAVYRVKPGSKTHYSTPGCNAGACGNGAYLVYEYTKTAIQGTDGVLPWPPRARGLCGRACTRCGCSWTTATARWRSRRASGS